MTAARLHPAFALLLAGAIAWLQWSSHAILQRLEFSAHDALAAMGRPAVRDPGLVFLARDTASAGLEQQADLEQFDLSAATTSERRALSLMANEWPWPREVYAHILDRLMAAGAQVVIFDFTFPKPSPHDDLFRSALERYRDRVVVAGNISTTALTESATDTPTFAPPAATLIPASQPRDSRIGFDNFWLDPDDTVRHATYRWAHTHGVWRSDEELSLAARALQKMGLGHRVPADDRDYRLRFAGPAGTYPPWSIYEIFVPAYWRQNFGSGEFFRDKVVLIGAAGNWQQDEHLATLGLMPGPELHLNAINAALHDGFIRETPRSVATALVLLAAAAAIVLRAAVQRPHLRAIGLGLGLVGWAALLFAAYELASWLLPCFAPAACFTIVAGSGIAVDMARQWREKSQLRRTLERYVSRNVVEELVDQPDHLNRALGGVVREVTVLFSDVRGFTQKAHDIPAELLVQQLNEYFSAMVDCVFRHGGTLDKFIGDAVMAVWGNTRSTGPATDARNAVTCAREMFAELERLNSDWASQDRPQFRIGIGINSGPVIVGNIGSPQRMEFTVIGDAVNVAWRLQERTKGENHLLLGEAVVPLLGADFPTEFVEHIQPAGHAPLGCYRLAACATTAPVRTVP